MTIKAKYTGNGQFHQGIPARDLTDEDWAQLTPEQQATVEKSQIYEMTAVKKPAKKESE